MFFFVCWCAFGGLTFRVYLFRLWNSCHDNDNCLQYWQREVWGSKVVPRVFTMKASLIFHAVSRAIKKARGEKYDRWNYWWYSLRAKTTKQIKGEWQGAEGKTPIVNFLLTPPLHRMYLTSQAASACKRREKVSIKNFCFRLFFFLFTNYFISIYCIAHYKAIKRIKAEPFMINES